MRGLVVAALLLLGSCRPVVVQMPVQEDAGVAAGLQHTMLMTEGCTAVDIGRGLVLTAAHCVDQHSPGNDTSVGMLVYQSRSRDFAVLFDTARLANPSVKLRAPNKYERVYAVGYPVQLGSRLQELTVTDGLIAGPVDDEGCYRFTAPIYYGNSGGGVWATDGALVGLSVSGYLELPAMNYLVSAADIAPWLPR